MGHCITPIDTEALAVGSRKRYGDVDRVKIINEGVGVYDTLPPSALTAPYYFKHDAYSISTNKHAVARFVLPIDQPAQEIVLEWQVMGREGGAETGKRVVRPEHLGHVLDIPLQCLE